jgi:hypothetical protein
MRKSLMAGIAVFCTFAGAADCSAQVKVALTQSSKDASATAMPAAKPSPKCVAPPPAQPRITKDQVNALLHCFDTVFQSKPDFSCELVVVAPDQGNGVFGNHVWVPLGQPLKLTQTSWPDVSQKIQDAVNGTSQPSTDLSIRRMALRIAVPTGTPATCLPGSYVLLMSFDCQLMNVYFNGKLVGAYPIADDDTYRKLWLKFWEQGLLPPASAAASS